MLESYKRFDKITSDTMKLQRYILREKKRYKKEIQLDEVYSFNLCYVVLSKVSCNEM